MGQWIWLGITFLTFLLSLTTFILPVTYGLTHNLETKILVTVASLNAFILTHLFVVVCVQLNTTSTHTAGEDEASKIIDNEKGESKDSDAKMKSATVSDASMPIAKSSTSTNARTAPEPSGSNSVPVVSTSASRS
jgi:hypothetical protein